MKELRAKIEALPRFDAVAILTNSSGALGIRTRDKNGPFIDRDEVLRLLDAATPALPVAPDYEALEQELNDPPLYGHQSGAVAESPEAADVAAALERKIVAAAITGCRAISEHKDLTLGAQGAAHWSGWESALDEVEYRINEDRQRLGLPEPSPAAPVAPATARSDEKTGPGERQEGAPLLSDEQWGEHDCFELWEVDRGPSGDDITPSVAVAYGPDREMAWREICHYALVYGQDGPVQIYEVRRAVIAAHQQPQTAPKG